MAEKTLEELHKEERDYYLGKSDKFGGKTTAEMKAEFEKSKAAYADKMAMHKAKFTATRKVLPDEKPTTQTFVTTVANTVVSTEVSESPADTPKDAPKANMAQETGNKSTTTTQTTTKKS